ncbi:DJ-1/PfpI family protein [Catellatospora sp. KI3]|uniref:DJ-1/PfpI family protein n=1 Tax=Catellatospora sp. KI3 TaxID=3041620 RepID=UPI0024821A48|nr:DJ-1/PfpI family protein [Catellatospora sp. KI3]MDI1464773.1 DJ-1/PfpI family protein [Catellatospora sp. KI3]
MPRALRRTALALTGLILAAATLTAVAAAGVTAAMTASFAALPPDPPAAGWPAPRPVPPGPHRVAVLAGPDGSVVGDVLAPYEVFARSEQFAVFTVSTARVPVALSGGLHLLPDYTVSELDRRPDLAPEVVVVPAFVDPAAASAAPLRDWLARQAARGARILGVCSGVEVVAAAGLLDGRAATTHWSNLDRLRGSRPAVRWQAGRRYVDDGPFTTTAGVTSGVVGALHVMQLLAGPAEAARIGGRLHFPGWSPTAGTAIDALSLRPGDLPYALNAAFPLGRPTLAVGLVDGVGELDAAALFELYGGTANAAALVALGTGRTVTTAHGMTLVVVAASDADADADRFLVPGVRDPAAVDPALTGWAQARKLRIELPHAAQRPDEFSFDPVLRDLAAHTDRATALASARFTEYPTDQLTLDGPAWPWRPTLLLALTLALATAVGLLPLLLSRPRRRA